jgi:hypothetical protein
MALTNEELHAKGIAKLREKIRPLFSNPELGILPATEVIIPFRAHAIQRTAWGGLIYLVNHARFSSIEIEHADRDLFCVMTRPKRKKNPHHINGLMLFKFENLVTGIPTMFEPKDKKKKGKR